MVAPDDTTFAYVEGRPHAPKGADWEPALDDWRSLPTDDGAIVRHGGHARRRRPAARTSAGARTRRSPPRSTSRAGPRAIDDPARRGRRARSRTWPSQPGTPIREIRPDTVFIGSCTNSRIEDLRVAADVVGGRKVADGLRALVVPGTFAVKLQAEQEGLDRGLRGAGFEWRGAGCSMCLGMNPDILQPGERSASHQQPQLRGPAGQGRADAPGQPARSPRPPRSPATSRPRRTCTDGTRHASSRARRSRSTAPTSTPTRSSRRVPQAHRAHRVRAVPVRRVAQGPGLRDQRPALRGRVDPARRARTSDAGPAASTRRGRSRTPGSAR